MDFSEKVPMQLFIEVIRVGIGFSKAQGKFLECVLLDKLKIKIKIFVYQQINFRVNDKRHFASLEWFSI